MKNIVFVLAGAVALLAAYLSFRPVPLEPVSWDAPETEGYVGAYAPNERLAAMDHIDLGEIHGPEDVVAIRENGALILFTSSQTGDILKINPATKTVTPFAKTGGVPLGMEMDAAGRLIVADAFKGLLAVSMDGAIEVLTDEVDGTPILYADDLDITSEGVIYFSDASTKFGAEAIGATLEASIMEIFEHARTGRILAYDPRDGSTRIVMENLSFANGVAIASDEQSILVNETGRYQVLRHYIAGPRAGETEIVFANLPGFPDNINRGPARANGEATYFLGLASARLPNMDALSDKPFMRKLAWRLPDAFKPAAVPYGFVMQFTADGEVIQTWQDPAGAYPTTTGALAPGDGYLYITALEPHSLGRVPFPEAP